MHQIHKLNTRHFKILDLVLDGKSNAAIAEELSISPGIVSILKNSPSFQHELAMRKGRREALKDVADMNPVDEALQHLRSKALDAAKRLTEGLLEESRKEKRTSATEILDRIGLGKVQKQDVAIQAAHVVISPEDAAVIKETLRMVM